MKQLEIPIMFCFNENYCKAAAAAFYSLLQNSAKFAPPQFGAQNKIFYKLFVIDSGICANSKELLLKSVENFSQFCEVYFIAVSENFDKFWRQIKHKSHFSKDMFYKLMAQEFFPKYDKIIISDVDVLFLGDISQIYFDFDLDADFLIAGEKERWWGGFSQNGWDKTYQNFNQNEIKAIENGVNVGLLIANLRRWREFDFQNKAPKLSKRKCQKIDFARARYF